MYGSNVILFGLGYIRFEILFTDNFCCFGKLLPIESSFAAKIIVCRCVSNLTFDH